MKTKSIYAFVVAGAVIAGATPAPAQGVAAADAPETVPSASPQGDELAEITVTAQRRAESNSKVPVSISAFNTEMLTEHSVTKETDLASLIPGLTVKTGETANDLDYALRGQTLDSFSGSAPGVLPYINDVAMAAHTESSTALYDMGSVQVLKGPQGTLFGRNAVGGAVLYDTVQPDDKFGGYVTARVGSYDLREIQGAINLPIMPGVLEVRIAADSLSQTGYVNNTLQHTTLGDVDSKSERVSIKFSPIDNFKNTLVFQYNEEHGTELNAEIYSVYAPGQTNNGFALNDTAYLLTNGALLRYLPTQKANPLNEPLLFTPPFDSHGFLTQNTTTYDISPNMEIKNIFGASNVNTNQGASLGGAPFLVIDDKIPGDCCDGNQFGQYNWSEELQLQGHTPGDELKYLVGAYAAHASETFYLPIEFGPAFITYHYRTGDDSKALFSQETLDLSKITHIEGLSFTAGGRYTWETLKNHQYSDGLFPDGPDQRNTESKPSWTIGLQDQITPETLVYVVTRGSWRAGGYNDSSPANNLNAFTAETTRDVEVGAKFSGRMFNTPAQLNIALYDQTTHNAQHDFYLNVDGSPTTVTTNAREQQAKGVEIDSQVRPMPWLTLGFTGAYTYAKFPGPTADILGTLVSFTDVPDTPRWTGAVSASFVLPTPEEWGRMTVRGDDYYTTTSYYTSLSLSFIPGTQLPAYSLLNVRYDWQDIMGSHASFAVAAKNVLDRRYYSGGFVAGNIAGENTAIPGAPRMITGEVTFKF